MKHYSFVLTDEDAKELEEIIRKSGKLKQKFFEDLIKKVIDGEYEM